MKSFMEKYGVARTPKTVNAGSLTPDASPEPFFAALRALAAVGKPITLTYQAAQYIPGAGMWTPEHIVVRTTKEVR